MLAAVSDNTISNNPVSNNAVANNTVSNNTVANAATSTVPSSPAIHAASNNYADAYKDTQENGKPLVILVGASWCPACQAMKTSVMPTVAAQGGLANVAFAYVNTDAQGDLAGKLMEGGLIPQLVMYEKEADGWKLKRLVGVQSVEAVQDFLGPAVKAALAAKQSGTQQPTATQPASATKQPTAAQQSTPLQHSAAG
jgi:thioredoxin-like negative regulator of GroEL